MPDPKAFYAEQLPTQWNRALRDQIRAAKNAMRIAEGMQAVDATLRIDVRGDSETETFFLNIAEGKLSADAEGAHPPFLTLSQSRSDFDRLAEEAGESALGFLGGLSGLAGEIKFTKERIEAFSAVEGTVLVSLEGEGGFHLLAHFGPNDPPPEPTTTLKIAMDAYQQMKSGEINPQDAFMGGQVEIEGDMQAAMQLAMAAMAAD